MQNVTSCPVKQETPPEELSCFFSGGVGFVAWWIALALTFMQYGANTLFFYLYTWPFFLALLPVSVCMGIVFGIVFRRHLAWMVLSTVVLSISLFSLLFCLLRGW